MQEKYHFSAQFTADLIAMNTADFIITSTYQVLSITAGYEFSFVLCTSILLKGQIMQIIGLQGVHMSPQLLGVPERCSCVLHVSPAATTSQPVACSTLD